MLPSDPATGGPMTVEVTTRPQRPVGRTTRSPWVLLRRVLLHLVLATGALLMIVPFVWMILSSLKSHVEITSFPPTILPEEWVFANYPAALEYAPFGIYFRNSLLISIGHTVINLAVASLAGYSLARLPFRGRTVVFLSILGMMMIPTYTKIVPQYLIAKNMPFFGGNDYLGRGGSGWLDSWWALVVPGALTPLAIFLFRQFYLSLPTELEEAARIDGMGEFMIFARVMTPLIKPAIATVGLITFESSWNNFIWPLLVTTKDELRVIQVGLAAFQQQETTLWEYLMAGTTLATLPMIVLFLITQRYFVEGLATTGIK